MDNNLFVNKDSLSIEDLFRQMNRPIILTSNGLMLPGDPSTLQKVSERLPGSNGYEEYKMPQLVSELEPVGVINNKGKLIGVRFQNFIGDDTNVVALSNIIPKARIYQGAKVGLLPVIEAITVDVNPDSAHYIAIPVLSKDFMTNLTAEPSGACANDVALSTIARRNKPS
ncbi:hypothetical protein BFJ63_vAg14786 [Fusarium oxysporum f. sp. narcissi]|uniref:Uncharacterized protein n=1 Tax=Fusarium oxysporum f. sp. narcissi TaxID=451672 RepID=A0A4Q2V6F2_FUSOX|nr:hypothetical protein BFJ63_vAg14786 [Fusarium oxysporum f. sp. narcissi]